MSEFSKVLFTAYLLFYIRNFSFSLGLFSFFCCATAIMDSLEALKNEKPNDNKFRIWKQSVEFVLELRELDDVCTDTKPSDDESELYE